MQNKILLAGGRSKLSDMSPEARSLGGCCGHLQASQGISNLPSQLSAEHKITKCNNNIFTGVPALPYWVVAIGSNVIQYAVEKSLLIKIFGQNSILILEQNGLFYATSLSLNCRITGE